MRSRLSSALPLRPALAVWLALCFHGPLIAGGFYRSSYDAATHVAFADHYVRDWMTLWEPRWGGGFSVASYPPLAHQLVALLAPVLGHDLAFGVVLLATLLVLPLAVWSFARLFVPDGAAGAAAIASVFVPSVTLTADTFGQLPTLLALVIALALVATSRRFVENGGRLRLALVATLAGLVFSAHHATPVLLVPPFLLAAFAAGMDRDHGVRARRAIIATAATAIGALAIVPYWLWALDAPPQAFIPHLSRADFREAADALALFVSGMYGVLPALALGAIAAVARDGRARILAALAGFYALMGLGGTTPLPSVLFGERWEWLTYDRFALWSTVALLPLAGITIDRLLASRALVARAAIAVTFAGLGIGATADSALGVLGAVQRPPDLRPIAAFLSEGDRADWRYQTFGVGDGAMRLGILTRATTIDTAYFAARGVPELAASGIGMLDYALWWEPSGAALRDVMTAADRYSIRWAFVAGPQYGEHLARRGFTYVRTLAGGIELWDNADAPRLAAAPPPEPSALGVMWGSIPLSLVALTGALALMQHARVRVRPDGRTVERRDLIPLPLPPKVPA